MKLAAVESAVIGGAHYVRLTSDDGMTGLGQSAAWAYPEAVNAVVERFRGYLIGKDPSRIEHHWQHLYRMGPFRGSILSAALSAVDIALWDLKGQRYQAPIWELLGGKCRERIRLNLLLEAETPEQLAVAAANAAEEGFTAIKFDPLASGYQDMAVARLIESVVEMVDSARRAVGPDVDLVVELHRKLTPVQVPMVTEALQAFRPLFVEDPIQIDSILAQAGIAARVAVPMGTGERLHNIWEFSDLLSLGFAQYCRPDVGLAGGLTQCKKIAAIAEAHHVAVVTHNCLGPVLTSASVHLDACIPNFVVQEYSQGADERDHASAFEGVLCRNGGYLVVPEGPGLGVVLSEEAAVSPLWEDPLRWMRTPLRQDGSVALAG